MNQTVTLATQLVKRYTPESSARRAGNGHGQATPRRVHIRELVKFYLRLGLLDFGGPGALVGQMERELVGDKQWLTKDEMREGIAVCHSSPSSRLPEVLGRCSASS